MDLLHHLNRLWEHRTWADEALFGVLQPHQELESAWREYAHVLAAEEIWLARLEQRSATASVWPILSSSEISELRGHLTAAYATYLGKLEESSLSETVQYTNSAGATFATAIGDILLHVALHGQYHRGKINLLLRQGDCSPVSVDYIGFDELVTNS